MKKFTLIIALVALAISLRAQNKQQQIASQQLIITNARAQIDAARAAIEALKISLPDSTVLINPDNLTTKKAIISFGKKDTTSFFYLNMGNKTSKITDLQARIQIGGNYYYLKQCKDTVCVYSENENILTYKIKLQ